MAVDSIRFVSLFLQQAAKAREATWQPATDIYRIPDGWLVKIELAGVKLEDVGMALRGRTLIVRGRRRDCSMGLDCKQLHMEIAYAPFERSIELPADLTSVAIESEFSDGMLMIRLRREAAE